MPVWDLKRGGRAAQSSTPLIRLVSLLLLCLHLALNASTASALRQSGSRPEDSISATRGSRRSLRQIVSDDEEETGSLLSGKQDTELEELGLDLEDATDDARLETLTGSVKRSSPFESFTRESAEEEAEDFEDEDLYDELEDVLPEDEILELDYEEADEGDPTLPDASEFTAAVAATLRDAEAEKASLPGTDKKSYAPRKSPSLAKEREAEDELPTMPEDVKESIELGLRAHGEQLPQPKNTTAKKTTPLTEKSSQATDAEEQMLEVLGDMEDPVTSLDDLLLEEEIEEAEEEEEEEDFMASLNEGLYTGERKPGGDSVETRRPTPGPPDQEAGNSTLLTPAVVLGGTISNMVKDNSSSIAGALAVFLAVVTGVGVACAGITIYRRWKSRKEGKPSPRIIEISSLAHSRKSPGYARVGGQKDDTEDPSRPGWEFEEGPQKSSSLSRGSGVKQKKAWDWDADW